jgi:hypothetical protein
MQSPSAEGGHIGACCLSFLPGSECLQKYILVVEMSRENKKVLSFNHGREGRMKTASQKASLPGACASSVPVSPPCLVPTTSRGSEPNGKRRQG